jgi:hypothetical protein
MKSAIIFVVLALFAVPSMAVTYKWEDKQGTINFTEDLGNIPKEYRKKAKIVGEEEESSPVVTEEVTEGAKGKEGGVKSPPEEKLEQKKTYGGRSAESWKNEFSEINRKIKTEEDELSFLKDRIKDSSKMRRGEYLSIQMGINDSESRLKKLRERLDKLNSEANRAGVPKDLR